MFVVYNRKSEMLLTPVSKDDYISRTKWSYAVPDMEPQRRAAITFGRYNICTIAHVHTLEVMASQFDSVTVGVIDGTEVVSSLPKVTRDVRRFYKLADKQHLKTTQTLAERIEMLRLSLGDAGIDNKVRVASISRPEHGPVWFNTRFPEDTYTLVFPDSGSKTLPEFDALRDTVLPKILRREITTIPVEFTLHTTALRHKAEKDSGAWKEVMTPQTYRYFCEINGPERMNKLAKEQREKSGTRSNRRTRRRLSTQ